MIKHYNNESGNLLRLKNKIVNFALFFHLKFSIFRRKSVEMLFICLLISGLALGMEENDGNSRDATDFLKSSLINEFYSAMIMIHWASVDGRLKVKSLWKWHS